MEDFGSLKVFRELTITGSPEMFAALGDTIEASLPTHWKRSRAKEASNTTFFGPDSGPLLVFERLPHASLPAAGLAMLGEGRAMTVVNIVPLEKHQLSIDQYNAVLIDFVDAAVQPAAKSLGLAYELSADSRPITAWLSERAAEALRRFSALANQATGSGHPRDRERWFDFLLLCHLDGCQLDTGLLRRWLIEIDGWPLEQAADLAIEYEFGRDLLRHAACGRHA